MPIPDTKQRILDAAERLFATHGYGSTSLRTIISQAKVNLAAIHYHFHSKEELLEAVVVRRAQSVNRERLNLLDKCEASASEPCLEKILEAFIAPTLRVSRDPELGGEVFVQLMGRIHAEGGGHVAKIMVKHFSEVIRRFREALERALPQLPETELFWRMHFTIGAMAHTLKGNEELKILSGGRCNPSDLETTIQRLVRFLAAGFRSKEVEDVQVS